ncbi:hypothetical protein I7I50_00378 [Histoplasma capsulatum G186AR]|uniref:Uncharacterized protein n=1 Tax=Ajellomyces capsulatus TaxID=5037 RepID=A0A8H8CUV2_AJECA|nr:hypothetical protein I7I52_07646 [Histoplasma capsulatum]QSS72512.1 hypothetical protein I7I50_00378 [Histoplasma capsulatum G186AR]
MSGSRPGGPCRLKNGGEHALLFLVALFGRMIIMAEYDAHGWGSAACQIGWIKSRSHNAASHT